MSHNIDNWSRCESDCDISRASRRTQASYIFPLTKFAMAIMPWLLMGCSTATVDLSNYSVRQISSQAQASLLTIAENQLRKQGYVVYQTDATIGSLRARDEANMQSSSRRNRGTRRHAEVRVASDADRSAIYCKVLLQQRVTEAHRMMQRDYSGQDTPNETPIDRDAATTQEQNTLWRTLRRDRRSEHELLNAIDKASSPQPTTPK